MGAWQTRGSGKGYNSLSGHCTMVGCKTGKVVSYAVRSKSCRICDRSKTKGTVTRKHLCRRNWNGSAKAMEPDMVVEMVKSSSVEIEAIVGDEDTSTISRLHSEVNSAITKLSDSNHIKKIISNNLYSAQKKHKQLSVKTIKYILRCFNYMCQQNKENISGLQQGLNALSKHPFGDHSECSSWCRHKDNTTLRYNSLPYGKPLSDPALQKTLHEIFLKFQGQATQKLARLGSTQANESLNHSVAAKAPKSRFYAGSDSLNFRVGSAVAQKNVGHTYVADAHSKVGISPGEHTITLGLLRDERTKKNHDKMLTKEAKLKRLHRKADFSSKEASCELREGPTYSTSIDLTSGPLDNTEIPPITEAPVPTAPPLETMPGLTEVFFDLETTGFGTNAHITQIAAVKADGSSFDTFVTTKQRITKKITEVTGISSANGRMSYKGAYVEAVPIKQALESFIKFVNANALLVAHNCKRFDGRFLARALTACKIVNLDALVFMDTLPLFKEMVPGLECYKQEFVYQKVVGGSYNAHNALSDARSLMAICAQVTASAELKQKHCFYLSYVYDTITFVDQKAGNLQTLAPLVGVLSAGMLDKIAASGLSLSHLKLAFKRDSFSGISDLFSEVSESGKVRVTKSKSVVDKVNAYFTE
ncbi:uncharacterized protein [Argopecten irradians]|uniref:uncharacterized protein n=1 Tax=Argopecten irradians TaxID=31199 RepID=UPI00371FC0AD